MLLTDALSKVILEALQNRLAPEADAHLASELEKLPPKDSRALVSMAQSSIGDGNVFGDNSISIVLKLGNAATGAVLREQMEKLRPFFQIPAPPVDFVGRATELDDLRASIARGGVAISGLAGMGGIGKTALACKLAKELASDYPDAAFYLDLRGVETTSSSAADALRHFIRSFEPTMQLTDDVAALRPLYLSLMQSQRAVVLLDNAKDAAQIAPLLPLPNCAVIVTSRQYFVVSGLTPQRLEKLAPDDARALLLKIAPHIGDAAEEMARVLGYLPLALRLAASALAERANLTPERYLNQLSEASARLGLTDATRAENEPRTIEAIFQLSYDLLDAEDQMRWRMLSVFADNFDEVAVGKIWRTEEKNTNKALGRLCNFSMVDYDVDSGRYSIHDLARDFAGIRLSENFSDYYSAHLLHSAYYLNVLIASDELLLKGNSDTLRGLRLFDEERANIEAGQSWAVLSASQNELTMRLRMNFPCCQILTLRHPPRQRIEWLEIALTTAQQSKNRQGERNALGNLGVAYMHLGDMVSAIRFYKQSLRISRELGERSEEGDSLNNLGVAHANLGKIQRAIEFYNQSLKIGRELNNRRAQGTSLGNLANAYSELGEMDRANKLHEQVLAIWREIGDRHGEGTTLGNLGANYMALGQLDCAVEFQRQHLKIAQEIGDQSGEGNALFNISIMLNALGQRAMAIEWATDALQIYEQIENPNAEIVRRQLAGWESD